MDKYFYHTITYNLIYLGLNIDVIKSFLANNKFKTKKDDTRVQHYFVYIRKYNDAILCISKRSKFHNF